MQGPKNPIESISTFSKSNSVIYKEIKKLSPKATKSDINIKLLSLEQQLEKSPKNGVHIVQMGENAYIVISKELVPELQYHYKFKHKVMILSEDEIKEFKKLTDAINPT